MNIGGLFFALAQFCPFLGRLPATAAGLTQSVPYYSRAMPERNSLMKRTKKLSSPISIAFVCLFMPLTACHFGATRSLLTTNSGDQILISNAQLLDDRADKRAAWDIDNLVVDVPGGRHRNHFRRYHKIYLPRFCRQRLQDMWPRRKIFNRLSISRRPHHRRLDSFRLFSSSGDRRYQPGRADQDTLMQGQIY
jgi:hypothetical protein